MAGEHTFEAVDGAATALEAVLTGVDVATIPGPGATRLVERLVRCERVLTAVRAQAASRAADTNQWHTSGERSPAAWLARLTGTTPGQAAAELTTTNQLRHLTATRTAHQTGQLSALQAREIAAAASADPAAEADLLQRARIDDTRALQQRCAAVRAAAETDEAAARERIRAARRFRSWTDTDGAFCFTGRGPTEDGAALLAALHPHQQRAFHTARRNGQRETSDAYAYDALLTLIRDATDHRCRQAPAPPETTDRPPSPSQEVSDPPLTTGTPRPGPHAKLIVRIDHSALLRGHTIPGETCEIAGTGPITVATARDLARDAFLTAVTTHGTDIRHVVHLGRAATALQRTALEARGTTCAVPGCGTTHGLEIDHVDGWATTRRTHIDQLDWLCHHHHRKKTHNSYRLAGPPGARTWHPPGAGPDS